MLTALSSSLDFNLGAIHTHYLHYQPNKKTFQASFLLKCQCFDTGTKFFHLKAMKGVEMTV